ncbi:Mce family protein [Nocardia miyunensis]|uniref:Mce family protein n=1 Tax=Nocardia miyunensis TaxID=282684 RepID=UPI00082D6320|nr:Mce family protein [Nocardia miyunensis]
MSKPRNQDFLRGTDEQQARVITIAAVAMIAVVALVVVGMVWVKPRVDKPSGLPLSIDVPFVAPGVGKGTKVILHGAEVGELTDLSNHGDGTVRMSLLLNQGQLHGLTDAFDVDFVPENYFGITAVNLIAKAGGDRLAAHKVLDRMPAGDYTMSTMLEKGSISIDGTLTDPMIAALNKVIKYTDGLTPMIQTGIVFADRAAKAQQAMPSELIGRADEILQVLPAFSTQTIDMLYSAYDNDYNRSGPNGSFGVNEAVFADIDKGLDLAANSLFGKAGHLLASHDKQLTPDVQLVQYLVDALPHMMDGGALPGKLSTLVDRYNRAFSTAPNGSKTLNLRVVLDDLPGMAAPLAATGLPQAPVQGAHR